MQDFSSTKMWLQREPILLDSCVIAKPHTLARFPKKHHADDNIGMHSFLMIDMCVSMHGSHQQE